MGAWGPEAFENDDAADWLYEFERFDDLRLVRAVLKTIVAGDGYLEAVDGAIALAAAEVVALALGQPGPDVSIVAATWVRWHPGVATPQDAALALRAVDRAESEQSELAELWDDPGDEWHARTMPGLRARLHAGASAWAEDAGDGGPRRVADVAATWMCWSGTFDDDVNVEARFRPDLRDAIDREEYPIQIGVAIPVTSPTERGWPTHDEDSVLRGIEQLVVATASDRAVLAAVLTIPGVRELVLYAKSGDWIPDFHERLQAEVATHDVQCMARHDPEWSSFFAVASGHP
ncbi:MAG: hypothetical protein JWN46_1226 [Acidimicrobiales bacterium]|nr:hypothetical protein [Acidimicrobiales bacterium]